MMGMTVRRGLAAGLMMAALVIGSLAMSDTVSAQTTVTPGVISTTGGPKVTASNLATTANSSGASSAVAVPAYNGYPFGYGNYFGYGYGGYPYYGYQNYGYQNYGYQTYGYSSTYPYNLGYPYANYNAPAYGYGYGYPNLSGNVAVGCVQTVSYTPAFGYGYGCQRVNQYPTAQSLAVNGYYPGAAYPAYPQAPYQVGR